MARFIALVSKNCGYCKQAVPILRRLKEEHGMDITVADASVHPLGKKISGVPTVIAVCDNKIMGKIEGLRDEKTYRELMEKANRLCPTRLPESKVDRKSEESAKAAPGQSVSAAKKKTKSSRSDPYDGWWGGSA